MVYSLLATEGTASDGDFAGFMAEERKAYAFTMKQQRHFSKESTTKGNEEWSLLDS